LREAWLHAPPAGEARGSRASRGYKVGGLLEVGRAAAGYEAGVPDTKALTIVKFNRFIIFDIFTCPVALRRLMKNEINKLSAPHRDDAQSYETPPT